MVSSAVLRASGLGSNPGSTRSKSSRTNPGWPARMLGRHSAAQPRLARDWPAGSLAPCIRPVAQSPARRRRRAARRGCRTRWKRAIVVVLRPWRSAGALTVGRHRLPSGCNVASIRRSFERGCRGVLDSALPAACHAGQLSIASEITNVIRQLRGVHPSQQSNSATPRAARGLRTAPPLRWAQPRLWQAELLRLGLSHRGWRSSRLQMAPAFTPGPWELRRAPSSHRS